MEIINYGARLAGTASFEKVMRDIKKKERTLRSRGEPRSGVVEWRRGGGYCPLRSHKGSR